MNRQQKTNVVHGLSEKFAASEASFVVNCQGATVAQMQELRLALGAKNSELQVAKNRLVRIAIQSKPEIDVLSDQLRGQNAIIFAKSDLTGTAKILYDFAKKNEEFTIVAGCYDSKLLNKASVEGLAKIPSREILLAQLFGIMKAPITSFVVALDQIAKKAQGGQSSIEATTENK